MSRRPVLRVVEAGLQTTVQDGGRVGREHMGIARGGALDHLAYGWANALAGNSAGEAVLECLLRGVTVAPSADVWIASAGAADVTVNGRPFPAWAGFRVPAGGELRLGRAAGARAYLAVRGGIDVAPVLGSRSTNLEAGFGGFQGRALRLGDEIPVGSAGGEVKPGDEIWRCPRPQAAISPMRVRVIAGPLADAWSGEARRWLATTEFTVQPDSNHMGIRLGGQQLASPPAGGEVSQPMPVGAVQITPAGQPVVLMRSRGTVGGYPVPATVASADLWLLAQARPGAIVRFEETSRAEAVAAAQPASFVPHRIALRRGGV